jgi:hypothetical protein
VGVSANKTLLVKFKQQRSLKEVALRLGWPGVYFQFNFVCPLDDVLVSQKCCRMSTKVIKLYKENIEQNQQKQIFNKLTLLTDKYL